MAVTIHVESFSAETDKAICVWACLPEDPMRAQKVWFPLSQVESIHRSSTDPTITVSDWIAQQKGFA